MASADFGHTSDMEYQGQTPSGFPKYDIDTGTEYWRKALGSRGHFQYRQTQNVQDGVSHPLVKELANNYQLSNLTNRQYGIRGYNNKDYSPSVSLQTPRSGLPTARAPDDLQSSPNARLQHISTVLRPEDSCVDPSHLSGTRVDWRQPHEPSIQLQQSEVRETSPTVMNDQNSNMQTPGCHVYAFPSTAEQDDEHKSHINMIGGLAVSTGCYDHSQMHRQSMSIKAPSIKVLPGIKQKFMAKKSCDRESQSLPETISSVKSDGEAMQLHDSSSNAHHTEGESARFDVLGQSIDDESTGDNTSERLEQAFDINAGSESCRKWIDNLLPAPRCFFLDKQVERHFECDVEPINGFLIAPVEYPETRINPLDKLSPEERTRRLNGTAGLKSFVDFEKSRRRHEESKPRLTLKLPQNAQRPPSLASQVQTAAESIPIRATARDNTNTSDAPVAWFLRPVQEEDLPQVLSIYNWEVENGTQALDIDVLLLNDIQRIFSRCRHDETPFIVAIAGTPAEADARRDPPAQPRPYRARPTVPYGRIGRHTPEPDRILGFGFLNIPATGLAGSVGHSVYRFQARVHLYVDSKHRRKSIGRALLQRLIRCCSIYSVDVGSYEWSDPSNSRVCDVPSFNPRNYSRLMVETASKSDSDPEMLWHSKFLDSEGFVCVSTMEKARKIGHDEKEQWLDNLVWELACQDPNSITENHRGPYNL